MTNRKYERISREKLSDAVAASTSYNEVCRRLGKNPVGGNSTHIKRLCIKWGLNTSHMTGQAHNRGKVSNKRKSAADILVMGQPTGTRRQSSVLSRALIETGRDYCCVKCGNDGTWRGMPLVLEVDHIDSQYWNNTAPNLQFMCPNCHTCKTKYG